MHGKPPLLPVVDARALIVSRLAALPAEIVPLEAALGRVLAADMTAKVSHPPADVSAMDGYAVRFEDAGTAPVTLRLVGEAAAGHPWSSEVKAGEAVRIFTGAHVPAGATSIVIQEDATLGTGEVTLNEAALRGRHIRPMGQDFRTGDVVLKAPRRLSTRDIGLLAAMNHAAVPVRRKPRVGVISTGDEIVMPGAEVGPGQLVSANGPGLCAFVTAHGGEAIHLGIAPDDTAALRQMVETAGDVDMLLTSGGVSVGDHDLVKRVLGDMGLDLAFHRIAMRPGKPLLFGAVRTGKGATPVMGLPGNPVSAMICAILFLGPALDALQGLPGVLPATLPARLVGTLKANDTREDYLRATLGRASDGMLTVTPYPVQDSAMVAALANADALLVRAAFAPAACAGDLVEVLLLDPPHP